MKTTETTTEEHFPSFIFIISERRNSKPKTSNENPIAFMDAPYSGDTLI